MFGKKKHVTDATISKLQKRVAKIPSHELLSWAEQAEMGIGQHLTSFRRQQSQDDLREALMGAAALYVVLTEIDSRN